MHRQHTNSMLPRARSAAQSSQGHITLLNKSVPCWDTSILNVVCIRKSQRDRGGKEPVQSLAHNAQVMVGTQLDGGASLHLMVSNHRPLLVCRCSKCNPCSCCIFSAIKEYV
jgi:hypothetical protein